MNVEEVMQISISATVSFADLLQIITQFCVSFNLQKCEQMPVFYIHHTGKPHSEDHHSGNNVTFADDSSLLWKSYIAIVKYN